VRSPVYIRDHWNPLLTPVGWDNTTIGDDEAFERPTQGVHPVHWYHQRWQIRGRLVPVHDFTTETMRGPSLRARVSDRFEAARFILFSSQLICRNFPPKKRPIEHSTHIDNDKLLKHERHPTLRPVVPYRRFLNGRSRHHRLLEPGSEAWGTVSALVISSSSSPRLEETYRHDLSKSGQRQHMDPSPCIGVLHRSPSPSAPRDT